jgi:hypothetical protein
MIKPRLISAVLAINYKNFKSQKTSDNQKVAAKLWQNWQVEK